MIFTNVSGAKCDAGLWGSVKEGPDAGEQESRQEPFLNLISNFHAGSDMF